LLIPAHDNFKIKFLLVPGWVTILGRVNHLGTEPGTHMRV